MEKELKKTNSLLKFYYKEKVDIKLKIKSMENLLVKGIITRKNLIGKKYVVLKGNEKKPIKIFTEDIELYSIVPIDYEKKENKNKRRSLPAALRYKILKRDRFTCQACGACGPDVQLEVDHKIPVSKGGTEDDSNLTTLCIDCNRGKSDTQ